MGKHDATIHEPEPLNIFWGSSGGQFQSNCALYNTFHKRDFVRVFSQQFELAVSFDVLPCQILHENIFWRRREARARGKRMDKYAYAYARW